MELTEEIKKFLYCHGADLVGIGDMSKVEECNYKTGIAVAVALPPMLSLTYRKFLLKNITDYTFL